MKENITVPLFLTSKEEAIVESFTKEKKRLLGFIRKRVADKEDAEDILQDVFYQLLQSFTLLEPIEKISAWIFRVARNKIIDKYRKKKPLTFSDFSNDEYSLNIQDILGDPSHNPEEMHFSSIVWSTIHAALEELPEEQRQVFIWNEMEGKSFKEISQQTNISVNTLLSRKRYAVLFLRKSLQELYDEL